MVLETEYLTIKVLILLQSSLETFCAGMVLSLYFYFVFSSFLANKGLLNLKSKTCLVVVG